MQGFPGESLKRNLPGLSKAQIFLMSIKETLSGPYYLLHGDQTLHVLFTELGKGISSV